MILSLAILTQYQRVTDTQTDRHTRDHCIYCVSITSCGKNGSMVNGEQNKKTEHLSQ